jgi:hypothetical protein
VSNGTDRTAESRYNKGSQGASVNSLFFGDSLALVKSHIQQQSTALPILASTAPSQVSDATLVDRILRRNANALEELYDRYRRLVYSMALRILQHAPTGEEVVQDIFLKVWRNASSYDASRPFCALVVDSGPE